MGGCTVRTYLPFYGRTSDHAAVQNSQPESVDTNNGTETRASVRE